jgi:hypothetical protein
MQGWISRDNYLVSFFIEEKTNRITSHRALQWHLLWQKETWLQDHKYQIRSDEICGIYKEKENTFQRQDCVGKIFKKKKLEKLEKLEKWKRL